jgi:hypothetical protein
MAPLKHGFQVMAGSLAAGSFVAITQILTRTDLDRCLLTAVWLFAVTLPSLVRIYIKPPLLSTKLEFKDKSVEEQHAFMGFFNLVLCNIIGFAFLFFHFGLVAGGLFAAAASWSFWVWMNRPEVKRLVGFVLLFPRHLVATILETARVWIGKAKRTG